MGDPDFQVTGIRELHRAGPGDLSFFTNVKYRQQFETTQAGAILVSEADDSSQANQLVCEDPYLALAKISQKLYPQPKFEEGVHPSAFVDPTATVDPSAHIGPNAVVMRGATIGPKAIIQAQVYVGEQCMVGAKSRLYPGARLLNGTRIGERVILHSGSVIGSDGFGFAPDDQGARHKIPQVGHVEIESD